MDIIKKAEITQKQELDALKGIVSKDKQKDKEQVLTIKWPNQPDESAYYGLAGDIVRLLSPNSESDPIALLTNFLVGFGNMIGRQAYFRVESDKHFMNMYAILVGETSKARKGTSWSYIKNLLVTVDNDWEVRIQSGLSSGEGLIWEVRDQITKTKNKDGEIIEEIVDVGMDDKRLLLVESEFASTLKVLKREGNTLSPIIRNAWDTGDLQSLTKNSIARSTNAHISILGHITKDELLRSLSSTESANGYGNRHIWICVKRSKVLPFGGNIEKVNFEPIIKKLAKVVRFAKDLGEIKWADETRPLWETVYPKLSEGKLGLVGSMIARAEAYVTRLACLYAILDESNVIRPQHLKSALAYWEYAENSARYIFRDLTGNEVADEIIEALYTAPEGMSKTDISNHFGRHKSSEVLSEALETLIGIGRISKESVATDGRDKEVFVLTDKKSNSHNSLISQSNYLDLIKDKFPEQEQIFTTPPTSNL